MLFIPCPFVVCFSCCVSVLSLSLPLRFTERVYGDTRFLLLATLLLGSLLMLSRIAQGSRHRTRGSGRPKGHVLYLLSPFCALTFAIFAAPTALLGGNLFVPFLASQDIRQMPYGFKIGSLAIRPEAWPPTSYERSSALSL